MENDELEKLVDKARKILEGFEPSLRLTTVLELSQSHEQSCLLPAYCSNPHQSDNDKYK